MLEKEFDYYLANQTEITKKYPNQYVVIVGEEVVASYNSFETALYESKQKMERGTFLIQHCLDGTVAYTSTFHSNVYLEDVAV